LKKTQILQKKNKKKSGSEMTKRKRKRKRERSKSNMVFNCESKVIKIDMTKIEHGV
jgi:hypothetical protein